MASKRKAEVPAAATKNAKILGSELPKKRASSSAETTAESTTSSKKSKSSNSVIADDTDMPSTPSRSRSSKRLSVTSAETVVHIADQETAPSSPMKATRSQTLSPVKEAASSATPKTPKAKPAATTTTTATKTTAKKAAATTATTVAAAALAVTPKDKRQHISEVTAVTSIWTQCWSAMHTALCTTGPPFLTIITLSYILGVLVGRTGDAERMQRLSSVGVVFLYLFVVLMSAYMVAMMPAIMIMRIFTSLVAAPGTPEAEDVKTIVYIRVLMLLSIGSAALLFWEANADYWSLLAPFFLK